MRAFILAAAAVSCVTPALAQQSTDPRVICENKDNSFEPAMVVDTCTKLFMTVPDLTNPGRSLIHVSRARAYARLNDIENARTGFDEAVRLDPDSAKAHYERGAFYHYNGSQPDKVIADMLDAIRLDPKMAGAHRILGYTFQNRGDYLSAISYLSSLIRVEPDNPANFTDRANVSVLREMYPQAQEDFDEALRLTPAGASRAYLLNGACFTRAVNNKELDKAKAQCDEAIGMTGGKSPDFLDSRALVVFRQSRFQDAWNDWDAALKIRPDFAGAMLGRGVSARKLGRKEEGDADIKRARDLQPTVVHDYYFYGVVVTP